MMNRKKILILIGLPVTIAVFLLLQQTAAAKPPLKPTEQYFIELRDYFDKIDKESNATAKDWEEYIKKITDGKVKITIDPKLTEKQKKDWLKSVALALLYAKNQFGFKLPASVRELKCEQSRPETFGQTEGPSNNLTITCGPASTNWVFTVFFHELAHMLLQHPPVAGREYEADVHNFIKKILPGVIANDNRPRDYDLFSPQGQKFDQPQTPSQTQTQTQRQLQRR